MRPVRRTAGRTAGRNSATIRRLKQRLEAKSLWKVPLRIEMPKSWSQYLAGQVEDLRLCQQQRRRGGLQTSRAESGDSHLDFGTNDYLGLRFHPKIRQAIHAELEYNGWGSAASPVLSGYGPATRQLENRLSELSRTEDCLVFSSGYSANVGALSCLSDSDVAVFSDRLNHASLIDGIRLGRGSRFIYDHCNLDHLAKLLMRHRSDFSRSLIVTESIFSMDGDQAPLGDLAALAEQFDCGLIVDEAHSVGVFGRQGGGLLEELELADRVLLKLGTLSKALGGIGGYAAGSKTVIDFLVSRCRSYVFSTAPPAAVLAGGLAAIDLMREMTDQRLCLEELSRAARLELADLGWDIPHGRSPIIPIVVGDESIAMSLSQQLRANGIYAPAIRPPTVPAGSSRLRISLTANHTLDDVKRLVRQIAECYPLDQRKCCDSTRVSS